ncbi:DUF6232 family protein [Janthinobacterium sp.]|uniref:DUF6232 family protein n=1 Tax=Janthinobacterium sp. TaxID=1871054 RepID=UPI00260212B0|nr:DUF6232 family protein [Janthinobacterium sp.]
MNGVSETTYYSNGRVTVTNARFIVDDETHAISGITSVKLGVKKPNRLLPVALMAVLFLVLTKGGKYDGLSIWHWAMVLLPGIIWLLLQRTHYTVTLASASGEHRALKSRIKPFVREVVDAINQAIIRQA